MSLTLAGTATLGLAVLVAALLAGHVGADPAAVRWALSSSGAGLSVLLAALLGCLGAMLWPRDDADRWRRGAVGEMATANLLAALPPRRWFVAHDRRVPGGRANIDHLVIGPTGVWVIDSKAYRARLCVVRNRVVAGSAELTTGPLLWEAEVVSALLGVKVRAVFAVHGAGVPRRGWRYDGTWVVPAERLERVLRRGQWFRPVLARRSVRHLAMIVEERLPRYA